MKHFTDFNLRKRLAELLVLSRLDYCDSVFSPLPQYLLKRLQNIEFAAASFVYGRSVNGIGDILKLNWLPVRERRDFNLLKLTFKALYFSLLYRYSIISVRNFGIQFRTCLEI